MNPSQTYAELDKVFLIRQKKGSYHVLTNENKLILKEEFDKVKNSVFKRKILYLEPLSTNQGTQAYQQENSNSHEQSQKLVRLPKKSRFPEVPKIRQIY